MASLKENTIKIGDIVHFSDSYEKTGTIFGQKMKIYNEGIGIVLQKKNISKIYEFFLVMKPNGSQEWLKINKLKRLVEVDSEAYRELNNVRQSIRNR